MSNPQQPELRRSGKGAPAEGSAKAHVEDQQPTATSGGGRVPEDNRPGHHPDKEQDKPVLPKGQRPADDDEAEGGVTDA